jgi:AraC-like DNA-binding protein
MYEGLLYIGFSQCLFATIVMFTLPKRRTHERLLTWWLSIMAVKFLILIAKDFHEEYFDAEFSDGLIPLTFGPILYLYTRFLADEDLRFKIFDLKHFVPFFIYTVLYFAVFRGELSFTNEEFFEQDQYLWARIVFAISFIISIVVYSALTFMQIRVFLKNYRQKFSFDSAKRRIYWMRFIAILYTITHGSYIIAGMVNILALKSIVNIDYLSSVGLIILAYAVSFYSVREKRKIRDSYLRNPETFLFNSENGVAENITQGNILSEEKNIETNISNTLVATVKKPLLSEADMQAGIEKLLTYMERNKPYFNPELTIQDLAEKVNIPKHHLTYIINTGLDKNFFNFINEYRVEEFKRRAISPEYDHLTLVAIAFDCGFNSKSSFHNIFKNITGQTPSEYKKSAGQ